MKQSISSSIILWWLTTCAGALLGAMLYAKTAPAWCWLVVPGYCAFMAYATVVYARGK